MHIADLEPCRYHPGHLDNASWGVPFLAIGWLEHPHTFPVGPSPVALIEKLASLVAQTREVFRHYTFRGVADCTFCLAADDASPGPIWSQECIIVPGERTVYASPGGIVHYIEAHAYRPPSEFVAAALRCPPCHSPDYVDALRTANNGVAPPMETNVEFSARLKRDLEVAARIGREKRKN